MRPRTQRPDAGRSQKRKHKRPPPSADQPAPPARAGGGKRAAKKQPTLPFFFATQPDDNSCQWVAINNLLQRAALTEADVQAAVAAQHPDIQTILASGRLSDCMAKELLKSKTGLQLPRDPEHKINPGAPSTQIIETLDTALQQQKQHCQQHKPQTLLCRTPEHALVMQKQGNRWLVLDSLKPCATPLENYNMREPLDIWVLRPTGLYVETQDRAFCLVHSFNACMGRLAIAGADVLVRCDLLSRTYQQRARQAQHAQGLQAQDMIRADLSHHYTAGMGNFSDLDLTTT